ncbi:putative glutamate receptor ionotropic, kainate 2-like 24, partial [Homarus americanus]
MGAPFQPSFKNVMLRVIESGMIEKWMEEVISNRVKEMRKKSGMKENYAQQVSEAQVVLGLSHLQGPFYLLMLGWCLASFTLLGEHLVYSRSTTQ